jgi:hypothetical protein
MVKKHYLNDHNHSVSLSSKERLIVPLERTASSAASSSPPDVDMEDDAFVEHVNLHSVSVTSPDAGAGRRPQDLSLDDEEDEWDVLSELSGASTEPLLSEDEDDIVPRSFSFSTPLVPSDDEEPEVNVIVPEPSAESKEEQTPVSSGVYGSASEHRTSFLQHYADLKDLRAPLRRSAL